MERTLLAALSLAPCLAFAQPTYTAADGGSLIGETRTAYSCNWMDAGPGGANQTWNFSGVQVGQAASTTVVAPSSTPYASQFPAANRAGQSAGASYSFWNESSTAIDLYGYGSSFYTFIYSNPERQAQFPMMMGTHWDDTFSGTGTYLGEDVILSGTFSATIDGWGTLILPSGTYANVLRLHYFQNSTTDLSGDITVGISENYAWLQPGHDLSLLAFIGSNAGSVIGGDTLWAGEQYTGTIAFAPVGIDEFAQNGIDVQLFPNPTHDLAQLSFTAQGGGHLSIDIVDLSGAVVRTAYDGTSTPGPQIHQLDLHGLSPGLYAVRITQEGAPTSTARLMIE